MTCRASATRTPARPDGLTTWPAPVIYSMVRLALAYWKALAERTCSGLTQMLEPSGVKTSSGTIRTFFRPDGYGEAYFRGIKGLAPSNF
jgi:hypothetical protein